MRAKKSSCTNLVRGSAVSATSGSNPSTCHLMTGSRASTTLTERTRSSLSAAAAV